MVPVIWAFFRAAVNAGTASAARIAIIAITTSNSMSVNAEKYFFFMVFMWVSFLRVVLRRFLVTAIDLNRQGDSMNRRYQISISEGFVLGFSFGLGLRFVQRILTLKCVVIAISADKVNIYF